ncbi:unnamed protein product, partial [Cyprideis torosa]
MALQCIAAGAQVIVSARRAQLLHDIFHKDAEIVPLDLTDTGSLDRALQTVFQNYNHIDFLILNAGLSQKSLALETSAEVEYQLMQVNYEGAVHLAKAVAAKMVARKSGQIAVTSSIIGKIGAPYLTAYAAAKHALDGYFESWRYELRQYNVGITIATLGFIRTDITKKSLV